MMTLDTNILVYAYDNANAAKQETAKIVVGELMRRESPLAIQCVGEFQQAVRIKLRTPAWVAAQDARNLLVGFAGTFPPSETACLSALATTATGRRSYWDALLINSAAEAGCTAFFSEDKQDADRVAGVEIVNPFGEGGRLSERARHLLDL